RGRRNAPCTASYPTSRLFSRAATRVLPTAGGFAPGEVIEVASTLEYAVRGTGEGGGGKTQTWFPRSAGGPDLHSGARFRFAVGNPYRGRRTSRLRLRVAPRERQCDWPRCLHNRCSRRRAFLTRDTADQH